MIVILVLLPLRNQTLVEIGNRTKNKIYPRFFSSVIMRRAGFTKASFTFSSATTGTVLFDERKTDEQPESSLAKGAAADVAELLTSGAQYYPIRNTTSKACARATSPTLLCVVQTRIRS